MDPQENKQGLITFVKGTSGAGKSSRVYQLIKFLEELGHEKVPYFYVNVEDKVKEIGIHFPEINLLFLGKEYKSGDIGRFQGYDTVTGCFTRSEYFSQFLKENKEMNIVIEGTGVTRTHRMRPLFLRKELGIQNIYIQYYNFRNDQLKEYQDRLILRSGKVSEDVKMWHKNKSFNIEYDLCQDDIKTIGSEEDILIELDDFQAPIYDFGAKKLLLIGLEDYIDAFIEFTENLDYISKNKFTNFK